MTYPKILLLICITFASFTPNISLAQVLDWQSTNIQYLRGHNHKVGEGHRSIVTIEHANKWAYGDNLRVG